MPIPNPVEAILSWLGAGRAILEPSFLEIPQYRGFVERSFGYYHKEISREALERFKQLGVELPADRIIDDVKLAALARQYSNDPLKSLLLEGIKQSAFTSGVSYQRQDDPAVPWLLGNCEKLIFKQATDGLIALSGRFSVVAAYGMDIGIDTPIYQRFSERRTIELGLWPAELVEKLKELPVIVLNRDIKFNNIASVRHDKQGEPVYQSGCGIDVLYYRVGGVPAAEDVKFIMGLVTLQTGLRPFEPSQDQEAKVAAAVLPTPQNG